MRTRLSRRVPLMLLLLGVIAVDLAIAAPSLATKKPPAHPIDINSANSAQLQEVPGIGPATADKILQMRKSYGAFKSVDDLLSVRGIGPKRLEKMRKYLVAGHGTQGRKGSASAGLARAPASSPTAQATASGSHSGTAPVKKAAVTPAKASKPVASDGDSAKADEEPE